jgi:RimJ/RimL family protein N-acetyltransferase
MAHQRHLDVGGVHGQASVDTYRSWERRIMVSATLASEPLPSRVTDRPATRIVPSLTDGTIVLDSLRPSDAAALAAMDDVEIRRAYGAADPTSPMPVSDATRLIDSWSVAGDEVAFAIRRDGALTGVATIRSEVGGWVGVLSVRVAAKARRARVGTRALRLAADYAVDLQRASRLRLDNLEANKPAQRLAESLGFKQLHHFPGDPGWIHHGMTHEEWEQRSVELARTLGEASVAA